MAYSVDFRKKVLKIRAEEKLSFAAAAKRFGIAKVSVVRWTKNIELKKTRNKKAFKIDMEALIKDVESHPDSYNYERASRFGVSPSGIRAAFKRLGISYKKNVKASEGQSRDKIYVLAKDRRVENAGKKTRLRR